MRFARNSRQIPKTARVSGRARTDDPQKVYSVSADVTLHWAGIAIILYFIPAQIEEKMKEKRILQIFSNCITNLSGLA